MSAKEVLMAAAGAASGPTYIEDVFSTYLYNGNNLSQTVTNGVDLAGEGGLVWIKNRSNTRDHELCDTVRGRTSYLRSNNTLNAFTESDAITSFNSNGFNLGGGGVLTQEVNGNNEIYATWTFRQAPKFFDVVTYTGTGANRTISHDLGSVPGCIIVKRTDLAAAWQVYHSSLANTEYLVLNSTAAKATGTTRWDSTTPTSTGFRVGTDVTVNASGGTYVAYLFAHNAGGFGLTGTDNVISCGSYTGNGLSAGPTITLGFEPQWLLIKQASAGATGWVMYDEMRGLPVGTSEGPALFADLDVAESLPGNSSLSVFANGFVLNATTSANLNASGVTYVYIAIRRGPMKTPTLGTSVFQPRVYTGTNVNNRLINTTIAPDMIFARQRDDAVLAGMVVGDRLRGVPYFVTGAQAAEVFDTRGFDLQIVATTEYGTPFSSMAGFYVGISGTAKLNLSTTASNQIAEAFKRAPGFFDAVCYTGNGTNQTIAHNLTVAPELIIVKRRDNSVSGSAGVYVSSIGNAQIMVFTDSDIPNASAAWNSTSPTSSVFSVGSGTNAADKYTNLSAATYVSYLFATCPGVSKVFSYTGNGTSQTINCGFTTGARFVLIKRTDTTGDWYVWDSARGIVAGNDPHLSLNTTAAEVTTDDSVDTDTTGFLVNQLVATNVNVNLGTYIGLAIA